MIFLHTLYFDVRVQASNYVRKRSVRKLKKVGKNSMLYKNVKYILIKIFYCLISVYLISLQFPHRLKIVMTVRFSASANYPGTSWRHCLNKTGLHTGPLLVLLVDSTVTPQDRAVNVVGFGVSLWSTPIIACRWLCTSRRHSGCSWQTVRRSQQRNGDGPLLLWLYHSWRSRRESRAKRVNT